MYATYSPTANEIQQQDFMRAPVVLHAFSSFEDVILENTASTIIAGLARCLSSSGPLASEILNSPDFWSILQRLHQHKAEADHVFDLLQGIVSSPSTVTADNYEATVDLANDFASTGRIGTIQEQRRDFAARRGQKVKPPKPEESDTVNRAVKAINIIYQLTSRIPTLISQSHLERNEAWAAYWSPIFRALSAQCVNPCREVRHRAVSALQRSLLSESLASTDHTEWTAIFDEVLFPLLLRLLKPEIYQLDVSGMSETRLQAATLLCKIFLRYLDHLVSCGRMPDVWIRVLELLDRMMNSGTSADSESALAEAVPENLKNILLVMAGSRYLIPPTPSTAPHAQEVEAAGQDEQRTEEQDQLWRETDKRVRRFLPALMDETFPQLQEPQQDAPKPKQNVSAGAEKKQAPEQAQIQAPSTPKKSQDSHPSSSSGEGKGKSRK